MGLGLLSLRVPVSPCICICKLYVHGSGQWERREVVCKIAGGVTEDERSGPEASSLESIPLCCLWASTAMEAERKILWFPLRWRRSLKLSTTGAVKEIRDGYGPVISDKEKKMGRGDGSVFRSPGCVEGLVLLSSIYMVFTASYSLRLQCQEMPHPLLDSTGTRRGMVHTQTHIIHAGLHTCT